MMTKVKNTYLYSFIMGLEHSLEYRFNFFVNILSTIFPILIQVYLWLAIYNGGNSSYFGYDFAQMMVYVAVAGMVSKFVASGVESAVNHDIHSGMLASYLIKPVKYIPMRFLDFIGRKFTAMVTLVVMTVFIITVLHITLGFNIMISAVLLFLPALLLGMILNTFIFILLSMLAFWLTEVGRFFYAISTVIMVLSGGIFPVSVLGQTYITVMNFLPFIYTTYFPITVLTGALAPRQAILGIFIQMIWIILLGFFSSLLWRRGIKKYVAVGG